jgi:hypothetical protein
MRNSNIRRQAWRLAIGLGTALIVLPGCAFFQSSESFSDSSGSISDSVGSSSDSSRSSSGGDGDSAYHEDLRTYTVAHVRADGRPESLRLGLAEVALERGVSNWEAVPGSFVAIGEGLAAGGVEERELGAFRQAFGGPGSAAVEALERGYASTRR